MLWYEKYRPSNLDDYVWTNDDTKAKLEAWIADPIGHPHLLLVGPTGTGKTTLAMIIRKQLDLGNDCKFIPASLRSGVDTIREEIVNFCEAGGFSGLKLIIMDEADRLSRDAQEMMRNVIDRYQEDVRFIFTGNNADKIIEPVQGRMWVIQIEALDEGAFTDRLIDIAISEGVDMGSEEAQERLLTIVEQNYPNMRKAISGLQWRVSDGKLTDTTPEGYQAEWETVLLELFNSFNMSRARNLVVSIRQDDFEYAYRVLYENAETLFGDNEAKAVVIIAEHLFRNAQAGLPDITMCACLFKLGNLR